LAQLLARSGLPGQLAEPGLLSNGPADVTNSVQTSVCSLDTIQQEMERLPQGTRRLAVQLRLPLDPSWIWSVLTDYANLNSFIPNLASSRQLWRRGNRVGLEQVGGFPSAADLPTAFKAAEITAAHAKAQLTCLEIFHKLELDLGAETQPTELLGAHLLQTHPIAAAPQLAGGGQVGNKAVEIGVIGEHGPDPAGIKR